MIYLDNAATTLQKPARVQAAVERAMQTCANPGRGGHKPSIKAAQAIYRCRCQAAELFGLSEPERIVFTCNATHALNIAIKSVMRCGGHAVISGYEHNSVVRPLSAMKDRGVTYTIAFSPLFNVQQAYDSICAAVLPTTRCVIVTHVSNAFGFILPIERLDAFCASRGIELIIDASQSAGVLALDVSTLKSTAFVCMPGHKSLYGPQGTGILISCKDNKLYSLIEGGTGSNSLDTSQPDFLPDIFESGTPNVPGIAGLYEGICFVRAKGCEAVAAHAKDLVCRAAGRLSAIRGVEVFAGEDQVGVLSFRASKKPAELCAALAACDICLRDGLHCSPLAHQSADTLPDGTCRASFSCFSTAAEVDTLVKTVNRVLK